MPGYISPLDNTYISLKRAARLIADTQTGVTPDEIMDLFKHALFTREFERPETTVEVAKDAEEWNLPLLRIEMPRTERARPRLAIDCRPQEYFAVKATTIAEILIERDALPGTEEDWSAFAGFPRNPKIVDDMHHALARIPYGAFPAKAHAILGDICLTKVKLRAWMMFKGYGLPAFLRDVRPPGRNALRLIHSRADDVTTEAPRGRPRKAAWPRIEALIKEMHTANPETPRSVLAFDAHKIAATEFDEKDLPSLETIQRQMKSILDTDD